MESATTNPFPFSPPPEGPLPTTINVFPSQHLDQLPVAALLAFVPRLRTTHRVLNGNVGAGVATGRTHYRLRLGAGQTLYISDNLLDLVRLIDGRRSIQALSDTLAEEQGRPVHPAEIVYLLRRQLVPGGLVELSLPLALPEPKSAKHAADSAETALVPHSAGVAVALSSNGTSVGAAFQPRRVTTRPLTAEDEAQWIPPGRRAERLRATRHPPLRQQRLRRASYRNLVATFLVILAAGAAFAFAHSGFSRANFTSFDLGTTLFGGPTPTATLSAHQLTPTPTPIPQPRLYIVQAGDTLAKIAGYFNVTEQSLLLVNTMQSPNELKVGRVLIIPTVYHKGANLAKLAYPIFYVVQQGDTLYDIAQRFGTSADALIRFNRISNPSLIKPGDSLVIPAKTQK